MAKSTKGDKLKKYITFTEGNLFKVKLRGERRSGGRLSLFLDRYEGYIKTHEGEVEGEVEGKVEGNGKGKSKGKTKTFRKLEYLNLHIKENPQTAEERADTKEKLDLAMRIRGLREERLNYSGEGLTSPSQKKVNFLDYYSAYLANYKNRDTRIVRYSLEHFKAFVKTDFLSCIEITPELVKGYKSHLQNKLNGETPYNYFTKFKQVCKRATRERLFMVDPCEGIVVHKPQGINKEVLSVSEIALLAKTPCGNNEAKSAFLFSCNTGLRHCDIKGLKWGDIDLKNAVMRKLQTKVKDSSSVALVTIDLNVNALKILKSREAGKPEDLVFKLPSIESTTGTIKTWTKKAGIGKNITFHCARHTFGTNLLLFHTDIKTVGGLMGHSGLKHTQKYLHLIDEAKKTAVNQLPEHE